MEFKRFKQTSTLRRPPRSSAAYSFLRSKRQSFKKVAFGSFLSLSMLFMWLGIHGGFDDNSSADGIVEFATNEESVSAEHLASNDLPASNPQLSRVSDRIRIGESLSAALSRHSVPGPEANQLAQLLRKEVDLRTIKAGDVFVLEKNLTEPTKTKQSDSLVGGLISKLDAFELVRSDRAGVPVRYRVRRDDKDPAGAFKVSKYQAPVNTEVTGISGRLNSSLYEAIVKAGGDANLANRFAEVFGSQLDFSSDPQRGDTFKMIVEKKAAAGRTVGFGRILAAEYNNAGTKYRGIYYRSRDGKFEGMFSELGESLIKSFLKNPMELTRIVSRFGMRFHPILGYKRAHNGTDFGAPSGTPYWAVADGVVVATGYDGGRGKYIQVRHENGIMTEYFHSSRIANNIHRGVRVKRGQVIGYVGRTGLAEGPHLHLGMKVNGRYVDFTKQKFLGGPSIPRSHLAEYMKNVRTVLASLDGLEGSGLVRLSSNP